MKNTTKAAIVVVAFNREESLFRTLNEIRTIDLDDDYVDLIISIDYSEKQNTVKNIATNFKWSAGKKKIITHPLNLGLRTHVMLCGEFSLSYDFIIMLEDDITPSQSSYKFTKKAIKFYASSKNIAGIALYSPRINEFAHKPTSFTPAKSGADVFLIKTAQSWGQAWSKEMWQDFETWYKGKKDCIEMLDYQAPKKLKGWPQSSWKKIFNIYLIETNKYFLYPYDSHSSNNCDRGFHNKDESTLFQVELFNGTKDYIFYDQEKLYKYDQFLERENLNFYINGLKKRVIFDTYGTRIQTNHIETDIVITIKNLKTQEIDSYSLNLKPPEMNVILDRKGRTLKAYHITDEVVFPNLSFKNLYIISQYYSNNHFILNLTSGFAGLWIYITRKILSFFKS
ncbi:hypothetical protein [Limnobacter alexandrii]|uniref:hypothetical protein n=1 Tax=Limnobacter alexandrii TaxID=2570352 RepID=UPI001107FF08|nr:hypothetical protein [Limnobacter alexandrii]